jgi:hypothetical protein
MLKLFAIRSLTFIRHALTKSFPQLSPVLHSANPYQQIALPLYS